jgi:MFS transporter, FSR family, fosmidomycin resistance protein
MGQSKSRWFRTTPDTPAQTLSLSCVAHALHDGYTDLTYVMLPVWQTDFGLSYATLATLRGLYVGVMASLQLPAGRLAERFGGRTILVLGTALAAAGYALAGVSGGLLGLCAALTVSGCGSSTQHPIASGAVSRAYRKNGRGPLGIYNFAGDIGKAALPSATSLLLTFMPWRHALWIVSGVGIAVATVIALFMPTVAGSSETKPIFGPEAARRGGFSLLFLIGVLDSSVRMGLLTYLPFLLKAKGASLPVVGLALALVFIGGAGGKFSCGWLGARVGVLWTVVATEGGTAACIVAVLVAPLVASLVLLPLLGLMLNGTSSVLYGTVPELTSTDRTERAFALFYTGTIGAGAIAPVIYGVLGDKLGIDWATLATAMTALAVVPLAFALAPRLAPDKPHARSEVRNCASRGRLSGVIERDQDGGGSQQDDGAVRDGMGSERARPRAGYAIRRERPGSNLPLPGNGRPGDRLAEDEPVEVDRGDRPQDGARMVPAAAISLRAAAR